MVDIPGKDANFSIDQDKFQRYNNIKYNLSLI